MLSQNSVKAIEKIDTQKELAKIAGVSDNTIARVHESGRCTLPFRGGNIDLRAGVDRSKCFWRILQKRFSRDGRHTSGHGSESGRAARAVRGRCGRLRATYTRSRDALSGSTGKRLCFRCIVATRRFPGGMRRPHILRSVEELRVICRVFRAGGSWNVAICCGPASSLFVGSVFRYGSHWFAMLRFGVTRRPSRIVAPLCAAMRRYAPVRGDPPHWLAMARYDTPGVRRFASPSPAGGVTRPDMARFSRASRSGGIPDRLTISRYVAVAVPRALSHCPRRRE